FFRSNFLSYFVSFFSFHDTATTAIYTLSLHDALPIWVMLVLNLPFKALMFLTLMRPSLVLFLVLWLKLVKDFLKVRCRLALQEEIGRAVQQECRDRSRMPSSA